MPHDSGLLTRATSFGDPFSLVVAAQSFHWTDTDTRWARLVDLLDTYGAAAMFWNGWSFDPTANDVAGIGEVYRRLGCTRTPDLAAPESVLAEVDRSALFAALREVLDDGVSLMGRTPLNLMRTSL